MPVGYVIGTSTVQETTVLLLEDLRVGQYVTIEGDNKILGLITSVTSNSPILDDSTIDTQIVKEMIEKKIEIPRYAKAKVKLLCRLNDLLLPDFPPLPGSPVRLANDEELQRIFSDGEIEIGKLIGREVKVRIKVNALFRHLAVLASTGAGKSNTVAVLSSRLAEKEITSLIFDYHGEYYNSDIRKLNVILPKINPKYLTASEFATLLGIRENAVIQYRVIRKAFREFVSKVEEELKDGSVDFEKLNSVFSSLLKEKVEEVAKKEGNKKSTDEVLNKIEDFIDRYGEIIDFSVGDAIGRLRKGYVNVVNLSSLDEDAIDAVVSHYLRRILDARKENRTRGKGGLTFPVITVIEEAHVLLSKDTDTLTKYWASRIAREGRKFGVGLVIVSQRPKGIDENILSQMTNKIILKMVEPTDKKYVLEASDNLSEDIADSLSSLDVGEAVIIGNVVRIPTVAKIDKFEGKLGGSDPDFFEGGGDDYSDMLSWGV